MNKSQLITTFLLLILFPLSSIAQESMGIPPSPTVASLVTVKKNAVNNLGKYVHDIPIWNINLKNHVFPVGLTYSSSGIKVEEIPSYVGTGWNLSAGGVITRSVIDLPDDLVNSERGSGILHTTILNQIKNLNTTFETSGYNEETSKNFFRYTVNQDNLEKRNDTEPDMFYYSFFGNSGQFVFNEDKEIIDLSNSNYTFDYTLDSNGNLKTFTVIDTQGTQYLFSEREYSQTHYNSDSQWEFLSARAKRLRQLNFYSSWHLKQVTTTDLLTLDFTYDDETLTYQIKNAEMGKICGDQQCEDTSISNTTNYDILNNTGASTTDYVINSKKIKGITSNFFNIQFNNTAREDLNGGLKLDEIVIKNENLETIKTYTLQSSYFLSPNSPNTNNFEYKRLKLDKLLINDRFFQEFEYYTDIALPHRSSPEQDFWGYFNDNNATSLVPKVYTTQNGTVPEYHIFPPVNEPVIYQYGTVDRTVNPMTVHMGLLKKIEYQTGGHKTLFYEPNDFTLDRYTNGTATKQGNGVRLDRIEFFDGENTEHLDYNYNSPLTGVSSGRVSYLPKFATHIPWNFIFSQDGNNARITTPHYGASIYKVQDPQYDQNGTQTGYIDCHFVTNQSEFSYSPTNNPNKYYAMTTRRFSSSQIALASNISQPLTYEYISIKEGNNGKKIYQYNILGGLDVPIPSNYNPANFLHRPSYKTHFWNDDLDSHLYSQICNGGLTPIGDYTLNVFNTYFPFTDLSGNSHPFAPKSNWNKYFGVLKNYVLENEAGEKVYEETYNYALKGDINNAETNKKIVALKYRLFDRPIAWGFSFNAPNYYSPTTGSTAWVWGFYDIYHGIGIMPTSTTKTSYYNNETTSLTETNNSTYTYGNLLQTNSYNDSKGNTITSIYKYPIDFQSASNVYSVMTDKNMLYTPIETIQKNNDTIISAQINEYALDNAIVVYKKGYQLETTAINYNYTLASVASNTTTGILNKDANMVVKFSNDVFGVYGNVLQSTTNNNLPITTVWGYNNALPIARIETLPYNQVNTWFQNDYNKPLSYLNTITNPNLLNTWLSNLRQTVTSRAGQIMTFTYTPFHAINSITGIDGIINTYEYDNFNRLLNIKDQYGNIVSEYEYNYKNEN